MTPRACIPALLALILAAWIAAAPMGRAQTATDALPPKDLALVDQATAYLQGLKQVRGRFEQTNARGVSTTGDLYLSRPGKARFQYDPPSGLLVVADGRTVSVYDSRLKTFDRAPLGATPLAILLAARVRLDQDVEVTQVGQVGDGFYLSARKASGQARTEGYLTLVFGRNPTVLRGWTLVDGQGQATRVKITDLRPEALNPDLFVLNDPRSAAEKAAAHASSKASISKDK